MKMLNWLGFYFVFPLSVAFCLLIIFYDLNFEYFISAFSLVALSCIPVSFAFFIRRDRYPLLSASRNIVMSGGERVVCCCFGAVICLLAPVDIILNGFKISQPETYAELHGFGRYVRHITIQCWVLIPIAFYGVPKSKVLIRLAFISFALIFPILIVDRNRLLLGFYALLFCYLATASLNISKKKIIVGLAVVGAVFVVVGSYRSGNAFYVESSGTDLWEGALPLRSFYYFIPSSLQQVVIYITTPLFNFSTLAVSGYTNPDYLLSQVSPFGREAYVLPEILPVWVPRFNVGTEFLPFLLYGGWGLVSIAVLGMYISLSISAWLFSGSGGIFSFLLFLRLSYSAVLMGFAPQFYIFLSVGFIALLVVMSLWSFLLSSAMRKDSL